MKFNLKERWKKYVSRKSRVALFFDILFFVLALTLVIPSTRHYLSATVIRYTLFSPRELKEVYYLHPDTYQWQLKDTQGNTTSFNRFGNQVSIVGFWATWCPPCVAELPSIQRIYDRYGDKVNFILVSTEPPSTIKKFMDKNGYTFPVYQLASKQPMDFATSSVPTTFIVSKQGRIAVKRIGAAKWDGQQSMHILDKLLAE